MNETLSRAGLTNTGPMGLPTTPGTPEERHSEGPVALAIEEYTAQIPSDVYLWAAGASILGSLAFKLAKREHDALFVGQWVAPFLVLGLYNKLVKVAGSDRLQPNT